MASEAYLNMLKEIPKDIQNDVIGSINIANEIHLVLKSKGMTPADLARKMNKSESEISKWLTGLHNFTFKTVRKISDALEINLVITRSSKIDSYEKEIELLKEELYHLKNENDLYDLNLYKSYNFSDFMPSNSLSIIIDENYGDFGYNDNYMALFKPKTKKESCIKLVAETKSKLSLSFDKVN